MSNLTSIPTFGNDIGHGNWIKYGSKAVIGAFSRKKGVSGVYREMMDNSVVLQDRYGYYQIVDGKKIKIEGTPIERNIENLFNLPIILREMLDLFQNISKC